MSSKIKILLIDDSNAVLRFVGGLLVKAGWEVHTATTLPAAVEIYDRYNAQLILTDFILEGGVTGLQVITAIFDFYEKKKQSTQDVTQAGVRPAAAILTLGNLAAKEAQRAASLGVCVLQKPTHGKETQFVQEVGLWLRESNLL